MSTIDTAAPGNGTPLGQILVERGLISEEQLQYALAEGQRTGEAIGEVIVRLGFAQTASIAQALATQAGGPTKSEYGYAVGFAPPPAAPPVTAAPAPPVEATPLLPAAAVEPAAAPVPDPELARLQAKLEDLGGDLAAARSETRTIASELETAKTRVAVLQSELEAVTERANQADQERAALDKSRADAIAQNADLAKRVAELEEAAAAEPEPEPARFAGATSHLLFVAGAEGYTLVEREGPPPAPGSTLELDGTVYAVTKLAAGPLPGRRDACAYLAAA